jgi:hypothetical protein
VNGGCTAASYDSSKGAACQSVLPYCGPGVAAISVGEDDSCCPVYQCPPCVTTTPANGAYDGGAGQQVPATSAGGGAYCDCTFPTCSAGTQVLCTGAGHCGYPCECVAAVANCTTDADCPSDMYCAVSTSLDVPGCDPTTTAPCVGAGGGGVCTGRNVQSGCAADTDCPTGQRCQLDCASVGCAHADASVVCCDPATDSSCHCDASGNCTTLACTGQCLPLSACESGAAPAANCPADPMPCTDAVQAGLDPTTCCPIYQCPSNCAVQLGTTCPVTTCTGGVTTGTDSSCCPIVACPCTTDADCVSGQSCVSGTCQ